MKIIWNADAFEDSVNNNQSTYLGAGSRTQILIANECDFEVEVLIRGLVGASAFYSKIRSEKSWSPSDP